MAYLPQHIEVFHVQGSDRDQIAAFGAGVEPGWYWRPNSCFLRVNYHGPFATDAAAWADAGTRVVITNPPLPAKD